MMHIKQVETEDDIQNVQGLMHEYFEWLKRDVDKVDDLSVMPAFTDLDTEFSHLPGIYSPPGGCLLLALYETEAAGCGALKKIDDHVCELKRMYVKPSFRSKGIGRKLLETLISSAHQMHYSSIRLDTHIDLKTAIALYAKFGFKVTEPFYAVSEAEMAIWVFMRLDLV